MKKGKIQVDADIDTPTKQAPVFSPMRGRLLSPLSSPKKESKNEGNENHDTCLKRSGSETAASEKK